MEEYIVGSKYVPWWCKQRIMPFRKADGTTGYEYHDKSLKTFILDEGDVLFRDNNNKIFVQKKGWKC